MKLKTIFFDLDNTLFPAEAVYRVGLREAWLRLQRTERISWPAFLALYARAREDVKRQVAPAPAARHRLLYFKRLTQLHFGQDRPAITLALMDAYDRAWHRIPISRIRRIIGPLSRHYTLGIITNQVAAMQLQKMRRIDPEGRWIKIIVTSEEAGVEKPGRRIFELACHRAGCRPSEAVLVGDSYADDVIGASRMGMKAVLFGASVPSRRSKGVPVIRRLDDLPALLKTWTAR